MTDFSTMERDPDVCRAIVMSMRIYIGACASAQKPPDRAHMVKIAYGLDPSTQAFVEVIKMDGEGDDGH